MNKHLYFMININMMSMILYSYLSCLFYANPVDSDAQLAWICVCVCWPSGCGRDVGLPVHEALHGWGNVPTPPGLLPASPQQLLGLLRSVPASGRLGRTWPQSLVHLLWGFSPDEVLQLPSSAKVSRVWTNVVLALLRSQLDQTRFWRLISYHSAVVHFLTSLKRPDC